MTWVHVRGHASPREEQALTTHEELARVLHAVIDASSPDGSWGVELGSSLSADDHLADPFAVSHAAQHCLLAAIDHARALDALARDGHIHCAAPALLARGLIENAATAMWLLAPDSRDRRLTNTLKWHMRNAQDHRGAPGTAPSPPSLAVRRSLITAVGARHRLDTAGIARGYRSSTPVLYADQHEALAHLDVRFAWRLCQGLAHGRPWASSNLLEGPEPSIIGLQVLHQALGVRERRAAAAVPQQRARRGGSTS